MTPHPNSANTHPTQDTHSDQQAGPASPAALQERAWAAVLGADQPVTAAELADLAGITRGAAAWMLTDWAAAGHLEAGPCVPGRTAPYQVPYDRPGAAVRVLVTGSRCWIDNGTLTAALAALRAEHGPRLLLVHGGCRTGADHLADQWARATGTRVERWPADWSTGRGAGPARNAAMVATRPAACLAFLAGDTPGTTHCANLAERAGIPTIRHRQSPISPARRTTPDADRQGSPLLTAALAAAGRGWHVIPLRPDSKRPAFPDHTAEHCTGTDPWCRTGHRGWEPRATTDPSRIRRAWSSRPYGIGVACGPSGLLVVDLDQPKPGDTPPPHWVLQGVADGSDVLAVLAERAERPFPGDTYSVRTGRGGTHLYFTRRAAVRLGNSAGDRGGLGWLIDTRGAGGYVVAAGSTVDGRPYAVLADRNPAPLPDWLTTRLTPAADRSGRPPAPAAPVTIAAGRLPAYLRSAVTREVARVAAATEGARNHTLYVAAVALGQLVAGDALPAELVTAELEQAAGRVGLEPGEAAGTIRSGLRAGARRPRRPGQAAA